LRNVRVPMSMTLFAIVSAVHAADAPLATAAPAATATAATTAPAGVAALAGRWVVDLRPAPDQPRYDKMMVLTVDADRVVTGSFDLGLAFDGDADRVFMVDEQGVGLSGSTTTTCGSALVECYDLGSANGIMRVRGWTGAGSAAQPNAPLARDVTLFDGSCTDPYFVAGATCTVGVRAKVDFGTGASDPTTSTAPGVGARLDAVVGGTTYPMTYSTGTGAWTSTATIPVTSGAGPLTVDLQWTETRGTQGGNTCTTTGGNKCKGTIADVHRTFGASTARSGPIRLAQVWEGGTFWANSFERCSTVQTSCTHNLVVKIGLQGSLADAKSVNDPIVSLRVVGGSQNQSLDCDPGLSQLKAELAQGCSPSYAINTGTACPGSASALWGSPQPWNCVALQTGTAVNQVPAGLNKRILGDEKPTSCTSPNHWSSFPAIPKDDPRIAPVFLAPYGSFNGSGNGVVPVTDFGAFYITGWTAQGSGFANPCQGNGDDPVPGNDAGYIVGHFIKYVQTINDGSGGDNACDQNAFGSCVAVLTE